MEEILNQILEEQRKQTEILQSIDSSLKEGRVFHIDVPDEKEKIKQHHTDLSKNLYHDHRGCMSEEFLPKISVINCDLSKPLQEAARSYTPLIMDYEETVLRAAPQASLGAVSENCDSNPTTLQDDNKLEDKLWSYPSSTSDHTDALEKARNSYTF